MAMKTSLLAAAAVPAFVLLGAASAHAATVTLDFNEPVPAPLQLNPDSPGIVSGNCLDDPCLGVNSQDPATLTTDTGTFSVSSFWFQLLGAPTDLMVTTSAGMTTLMAADYGFNNGGQFIDVSSNALFQNITSLSFLTNIGNARIDNLVLDVQPIPLPASAVLLLAGIGGIAAFRRKKLA
jgi:hypothetical protein